MFDTEPGDLIFSDSGDCFLVLSERLGVLRALCIDDRVEHNMYAEALEAALRSWGWFTVRADRKTRP